MNFGKMFDFGEKRERERRENAGFDEQAIPPQVGENCISEEENAILAEIAIKRMRLESLISEIEQTGESHPEYPQLEAFREKLREMNN